MPEGGPLDYAHWRMRYWIPATRAIGLPWLTFRDLRRANPATMVCAGIDLTRDQPASANPIPG